VSGDEAGIDRAWEGLARAIPDGDRKSDAWRHLGALRAAREDLEGAGAAFREAAVVSPDDPDIYRALAALARRRGDQEGLRENLGKALALAPDPELERELALAHAAAGGRDEAVALWRELAEAAPGAPVDEATEDARARLLDLLRPAEGELSAEFEEALYRYSENGVEFYNLGVEHFKKRQWDPAEKAFLRAMELKTAGLEQDCRAYLMAIYREKNDVRAMLAQAAELYIADPSKREHRDLMAAELEVAKRWEDLEKAAESWTAIDPADPDNWRYLALAQSSLKRPDPDIAKSLLSAARAERPGTASGWLAAAEALEKAADPHGAKSAYEQVIALDDKNVRAAEALLRLEMARQAAPGAAAGGAASLGITGGGGRGPAAGGGQQGAGSGEGAGAR
jgi:tetratricopeptide (TPR) repeat protein